MTRKHKHCRQIRWTTIFFVLLLAGCGSRTVQAGPEETVSTALFDFTVSEAQPLTEYPGVTIPEGERLISLMMTVTNTSEETLPLFAQDFQFHWGEEASAFGGCLDALDDQMMPYAQDLAPGTSGGGLVLVLVPRDCTTLTVAYGEQHADGTAAGRYFVEVPL